MFDLSRNFWLLKVIFHLRRLRTLLPDRNTKAHSADRLRGEFYEQLWQDAAAELGAECKRLGYGICRISRDGLSTRVHQNRTAIDDFVTMLVALNKTLVNRLLVQADLPIPRHVEFTLRTLPDAAALLEQIGEGVVKPANGTGGGQGVTAGIRTRQQLAWAATYAAQAGGEMLLEQYIPGDNYRLLYLDGVLLDAIQRRPPCVTGDGRSTVDRLVEETNAARLRRGSALSQVLITIDQDLRQTLARKGLSLSTIPAAGEVVQVKTVISQNFGEDNVTVTDRLCPALVADGARAASAIGVRLAGIDIITRDASVPLKESGGVILEVNTTPGFHYHYHKNDGSYPVAVRVLEQLLRDLEERRAAGSGAAGREALLRS